MALCEEDDALTQQVSMPCKTAMLCNGVKANLDLDGGFYSDCSDPAMFVNAQ